MKISLKYNLLKNRDIYYPTRIPGNKKVRIQENGKKKKFVLNPGDHYVTNENAIISTLLGSCVSACLFDSVNRVMGMNHFLLSDQRHHKSGSLIVSDAGRYGIHAMELVINGMLKLGASRRYLRAKAFGGGNVLFNSNDNTSFFCAGEVNSRFIKEFLTNEQIPLVTSDLGGNNGRVIEFHGSDFSVYVRKIAQKATSDLQKRDKEYWKKTIDIQAVKETEIDLW